MEWLEEASPHLLHFLVPLAAALAVRVRVLALELQGPLVLVELAVLSVALPVSAGRSLLGEAVSIPVFVVVGLLV